MLSMALSDRNMDKSEDRPPFDKIIKIRLSADDLQIVEKFRGQLSPEAFILALLRMIDSGVVSSTPDWVKSTTTKADL